MNNIFDLLNLTMQGLNGANTMARPQMQSSDPLMAAMMQRLTQPQQQFDITSLIREARNTPVQDAQNAYQTRLVSDPWGQGGAFEGRRAADRLTPDQIAMSQGANATNQWAAQNNPTLAKAFQGPTPEQNRAMLGAAGLLTPSPTTQPAAMYPADFVGPPMKGQFREQPGVTSAPINVSPMSFSAGTTGNTSFGAGAIPGQTPQRRGTINGMPAQQAIAEATASNVADEEAYKRQQAQRNEASLTDWRKRNPKLAKGIRDEVNQSYGVSGLIRR